MAVVWGTWADEVESEAARIAHGLRQRDISVLSGLIEQYQYRLVRYFVHLTGRRDIADDLVQDTWLRVLERGSQYDGHSRFEPWLFAVARNLAIDSLRKPLPISLNSDENGRDQGNDWPSADASPFEQAARNEDAKRLAVCLGSLDPLYREVLVLRFQEDLSLSEIADVVRAPVSTVSSRIYRALATLRAHFGEEINAD
ncbi:MAG: RNA polymerase sigma factor [Acidobacteriaceae bacterium]|jgi:RNA polymerase sigma-70 factor (ECF subfamily)